MNDTLSLLIVGGLCAATAWLILSALGYVMGEWFALALVAPFIVEKLIKWLK